MSPAVSDSSPKRAKKVRKVKEFNNRVVTNLPPEYTWKVRADAATAGLQPAALVRLIMVEGYRARGLTPKMIKAEWLAHLATTVQAEADAEAAKAQAEADTEAAELAAQS